MISIFTRLCSSPSGLAKICEYNQAELITCLKSDFLQTQRKVEALLESITLIAYLYLEFYTSLNSYNTKLAISGDHLIFRL